MKKDKKTGVEMSDKKRLQGLVWDGLFNSLEDKPAENKISTTHKKEKKGKKANGDKEKPQDNASTE